MFQKFKRPTNCYVYSSLVLIFGFIFGEFILYNVYVRDTARYEKHMSNVLSSVERIIREEIYTAITSGSILEVMLKSSHYNTDEFGQWAKLIMDGDDDISVLELAKDGFISDIYPLEENENVLGYSA